MKRRLLGVKRDVTGLACIVGMGLLVLLAWAMLPDAPAQKIAQEHGAVSASPDNAAAGHDRQGR